MYLWTFAVLLIVLLATFRLLIHFQTPNHEKNGRKLPPGPPTLPVIGNLHMLGQKPHRSLQKLANKYGPIMSVRLGYVPAIVVSSPRAAELFLKTHDAIFANRPDVQSSRYLSYGARGLAFTEYGSYWRSVRKLCTLELLNAAKIDSFADMRRRELKLLVEHVKEVAAARGGGEAVVALSERVEGLVDEMTYKMVFGRSKDERFGLKKVVQETMALAGAFNAADYVPFLGALDLQGLTRRLKATSKAVDEIVEIIIKEHEEDPNRHQKDHHRDFLEVMLSQKIDDEYSSLSIDRASIKAIVLDMVAGAGGTSATAIEWTLSELLRNPRVMRKLQEELDDVVAGESDQMVDEKDLSKLDYLDMVIKETLRLHPVGPLLIPHESTEDVLIGDYFVPKRSRVMINVWAIGRDPNVWSDNVEEFLPERFVGRDVDLRGRDFRLIPFGSGRRICPGMNLGLLNVKLVVAQLVHSFHWELPNGMSPEKLDMTENFGLTAPRAQPLLAVPIYRLSA